MLINSKGRNYFLPTALTALSSCQQLLNASNYVELDQTFINRSSQPGVSARGGTPMISIEMIWRS